MDPILIPILALSIPLVAVLGGVIRLTIKPIVDSMGRLREMERGSNPAQIEALEQRLAALEEHLQSVDRSVGRLEADADFRRQLNAPQPPAV